jgi:hypothetical protein
MPAMRFIAGEIPQEKIPDDFQEILSIGKKNADVDLFGCVWTIATIEEWERRELTRRTANLDIISRTELSKVDLLTQSIVRVQVRTTGADYDFQPSENKPLLRTILLSLDSKIIGELYAAYNILEESAMNSFQTDYPNLREKIKSDFFGSSGRSLEHSDSETLPTPPSTDS